MTQRWWQTERSKYGLFISEVVEVECARADPELAARRRAVLSDVVLFPIDEKDTEISKKNDDTRTNSGERRPGRGPHRRGRYRAVRLFVDLEFSPHCERSNSVRSRKNTREKWLHPNENLHT